MLDGLFSRQSFVVGAHLGSGMTRGPGGPVLLLLVVALATPAVYGQSKNAFDQPTEETNQSTKAHGVSALLAAAESATPVAVSPSSVGRPKYSFLRHNEDWSGFAGQDTSQTGDLFDSIKYIPLSDDGSVWVSLGGHIRIRTESWGRFGFGAATNHNDNFTLARLAVHSDIHFGKNFRVFLEGKTAGSTRRDLPGGHRTLDVDSLALEQAFFDLTLPSSKGEASLTIRGGRQALLFGKQRLVSPLPWSNTLRRWDGVSLIIKTRDGWKITGFYAQFVPVQKYTFNDADAQTEFSGIYATNKADGIDLYWLYLDKSDTTIVFNGTMGDEQRHTVGGRLWGKSQDKVFDYDIEGAYQFGDVGSADISAYMLAVELGLNLKGGLRVHFGFDYASGDEKASDSKVETFNHLFPLGHAFLGYIDTIGRQNILDFSAGVTLKPIDKLIMKLTGHFFYRADDSDSLYNAGGGIARAGGTGLDRKVGQEIDLTLKYPFTRHITGTLGYSHFFADTFLEQSGAHKDIDFLYLIMQYTF